MKLVIPVESIVQNKGGVILYDPEKNKILKQYVHNKDWIRVGWRGGKLFGDVLIATDWQDLHYFNVREWKYLKTFRKNTFNDLHYIEIHEGYLYVVNTGLDAIEKFSNPMEPKFESLEFVFDKNKKLFRKRKIDLKEKHNEKLKFKPHSCHPNCIAFDRKRVFVTCFAKQQKHNSGEIIDILSGKRLTVKNYDCHDGIFVGDDYYLTRTRFATILIFNDLKHTRIPTKPSRSIKIGKRGWWRGMAIHNDIAYVFASDGYRKRRTTVRIAIVDLKTGNKQVKKLPAKDGVYWDTIYQPNVWED